LKTAHPTHNALPVEVWLQLQELD